MPRKARSRPKTKRTRKTRTTTAPQAPAPGELRGAVIPVVGIGASAGGFEAFSQLLRALPSDTGMAFVFVQHLEPEHQSMLPRLFSRVTQMPVDEALNGQRVEPNHVYVIPPKSDIGVRDGVLQITSRKLTAGRHMPVDSFFAALAEDYRGSAIGVVLSGTASDGTLGLKAIKAEGGVTFAQDEASSKYSGMPRSAINAGCVDYVLPPERIGKELARLARHPYIGAPILARTAEPAPEGEDAFRRILHLLRTATGVDFTHYKPATIHRRIDRRMVLRKLEDMQKYVGYLQANRGELEALFQDILIHVTTFFREPEAFKVLQGRIFPSIMAGKKHGQAVRLWAPGCSTGEEVYSLAIALLEFLGDRASAIPIQIFGTDISDLSIEKARSGVYTDSVLQDVSPARLRRFFSRTEAGYQVNKSIREICIFARQDLIKDPPFSRLDLISCRNVLIYLGAVLQRRVIASFHYALLDTGYLLLGGSETVSAHQDLFAPAHKKVRIYAKRTAESSPVLDYSASTYEKTPPAPVLPELSASVDVLREADRVVWQRYSHAGLVLNDNLDILHFRGDTSPYLAPASGKASLNVLRMVRDEFKMDLRSALHKARKDNAPVRRAGIRLRFGGRVREVNLEVEPLAGHTRERYFLVLFDELAPAAAAPAPEAPPTRKRALAENREIATLRNELETTREYLQSIVEQQEATNEELKSANEEILSSNEELQSTNEELETAKEELQSTNEELVTLNETLQNRNAELAQLSDDLNNVLGGTNIPVLIVGEDGRIRRFTPAAAKLLNLLPGDVGRPIGNIRPNIDIPDLDALMAEVSRTLGDVEREVRDHAGHWYAIRIRPYLTSEKKIDGALLAFIDIDDLKRTNEALRDTEATVRGLMDSAGEGIVAVSQDGRMRLVNAIAERLFGYAREEMIGQPIEFLMPPGSRERHVRHRADYFAAPQKRPMGIGMDLRGRNKGGGEFPVEVALGYVQTAGGLLSVSFIRDVSVQRQAEAALAQSQAALRLSEQQLQTLTASLLSTQEEERQRIARELHDDMNQRLATLAIQAEGMEQQLPVGVDGLRDQVRGFRETVAKMSDDVRNLAHELHPSILEHFGLGPALRSYCEEFTRAQGIRVKFKQRDLPETVPDDVALCLYRITQECLRNIAKHSGAALASVAVAGLPGAIHLAVGDRGAGFNPEQVTAKRGLGLISARERVRLVGGTLSIIARPGGGAQVEIRVPLPEKQP